jgi:hypothetical protein
MQFFLNLGRWVSLVARLYATAALGGSNPDSPQKYKMVDRIKVEANTRKPAKKILEKKFASFSLPVRVPLYFLCLLLLSPQTGEEVEQQRELLSRPRGLAPGLPPQGAGHPGGCQTQLQDGHPKVRLQ